MSNVNGSSNTSSSRFALTYQMLTLSPASSFWPPSSVSLVTLRRKYMTGDAQRTISSVADCASDGSFTSSWYCSGLSQNARMPCEIELRVVSLPATAISRKKRLKSISDSVSPSTSASRSVETMSSRGISRRSAASALAYMNISICAFCTSSSETMYSGSSLPIIRLLHSKSLCRSACGTPSISAITWSGSSAATSTTKSDLALLDHLVEDAVGLLADAVFERTDLAGREAAVDELAVARVLGRVHREHEVAALLEVRLLGRLLEHDHAAARLVGRVGAAVAADGDDVGVLGDDPEARPVGLGVLVDRCLAGAGT